MSVTTVSIGDIANDAEGLWFESQADVVWSNLTRCQRLATAAMFLCSCAAQTLSRLDVPATHHALAKSCKCSVPQPGPDLNYERPLARVGQPFSVWVPKLAEINGQIFPPAN